jgi:putative flippase GtrA
MHNYDFGSTGSAHQSPYGEPEHGAPRKHSMFSLIAMIVVVAVLAMAGLGIAFWALGFLFSLAGWILKVAVLTAVAAFVWRRINRRWSHDRV